MSGFEVAVLGEPLLEFSAAVGLDRAETFRLSFSGDALNAAAAAKAAGAGVALMTRVGSDELSNRLVGYVERLGIRTELVRRTEDPNGLYVLGADPAGEREFVYFRAASAASRMTPQDLDTAALAATPVLLISGITMALAESCADTVVHAARTVHGAGGTVIYDPNFRRRLATAGQARAHFTRLAPFLQVAAPSCPADTEALFGTDDPHDAARRTRELGAAVAVVTCGEHGVLVDDGTESRWVPAVPAPRVVDATGAGDVFAGTLAARLAAGDPLDQAVRLGCSAASLSLAGQGGTGRLAGFDQVRTHLRKNAG